MAQKLALPVIPLFVSVLIFPGAVYSAELMSANALRDLLAGNTMYCRNLYKDREFIKYFREDGIVTKQLPDGSTMEGMWRISETGEHCQDWGLEDGECCFPVVDRGDGTYQKIDKGKPKTEFTVIKGNANDL